MHATDDDAHHVACWLDHAARCLNPSHALRHTLHCHDVLHFLRNAATTPPPLALRAYWRRAVWPLPAEPLLAYYLRCLAHHSAVTLLSPHIALHDADGAPELCGSVDDRTTLLTRTTRAVRRHLSPASSAASSPPSSSLPPPSYDDGACGVLFAERCRVVGLRLRPSRRDVVQTGWHFALCSCATTAATTTMTTTTRAVRVGAYAKTTWSSCTHDTRHGSGAALLLLPTRYGGGRCDVCGHARPRAATWCRRYFVVLQRCDGQRHGAVAYGDDVGGVLRLGSVLDTLLYVGRGGDGNGASTLVVHSAMHAVAAVVRASPPQACGIAADDDDDHHRHRQRLLLVQQQQPHVATTSLAQLAQWLAPELVGHDGCKRLVLLSVLYTLYGSTHALRYDAWPPLHVLLVGGSRCGKTTLLQRVAELFGDVGNVVDHTHDEATATTAAATTASTSLLSSLCGASTTSRARRVLREAFVGVVAGGGVLASGPVASCAALLVDGVDAVVDDDGDAAQTRRWLCQLLQHGCVCHGGDDKYPRTCGSRCGNDTADVGGKDGADDDDVREAVDGRCAAAATTRFASCVQVMATAHVESVEARALLGDFALVARLPSTHSLHDTTRISARVLSASRARAASTRHSSRARSRTSSDAPAAPRCALSSPLQQQQEQRRGCRSSSSRTSSPTSMRWHASVDDDDGDGEACVSAQVAPRRLRACVQDVLRRAPATPAPLHDALHRARVREQLLGCLCEHWSTLEQVACAYAQRDRSAAVAPAPASMRCEATCRTDVYRPSNSSSSSSSGDVYVSLQRHMRVLYALCLARLLLAGEASWRPHMLDDVWACYTWHLHSAVATCGGDSGSNSSNVDNVNNANAATAAEARTRVRLAGDKRQRGGRQRVLSFVDALRRAQQAGNDDGGGGVLTDDDVVRLYRTCGVGEAAGEVYFAVVARLQHEGVLLRRPGGWHVTS